MRLRDATRFDDGMGEAVAQFDRHFVRMEKLPENRTVTRAVIIPN
jgi:hypothetical protein